MRMQESNLRNRLMRPCWNRLQSNPQQNKSTFAFVGVLDASLTLDWWVFLSVPLTYSEE